ncbi:hypothetical protein ACN27G_02615 [Plantactinospora sp. WMMB334]|uniref:hypothetical protein n=1 Tax=Plantactinospora sp. WMMB334 TaxID=3404119 RepID=UPI003B93646F
MGDPEFQVSGGAGGTGARYEDIGLLARQSDDLARDLAGIGVQGHGMLADPDLVASAVLHPDGFARIEAGLLRALDGRRWRRWPPPGRWWPTTSTGNCSSPTIPGSSTPSSDWVRG